ncbi:hypothetical protein H2200_005480 [Cladophialophora chaetospira]|uniref:Bul1 C-terminal domain-containing protein n=1 Tax=Cladophialophora chaetospira TaxID=386627 RepID=A0AA38XC27_9EURO|nr:hypothetical protein H2200_005480 [Cladophialophora chaetospira]
MEISFINALTLADSKDPYFLGDRGIDGYLSLTDSTAIGLSTVKLSLEGGLVNTLFCLDWYAATVLQKTQKLLDLTTVKKPTDFIGTEEQTSCPPKCFFHFDIPKTLHGKLLGQDNAFLGDLPASIPLFEPGKKHAMLQPRCSGQSKVVYVVRAQAFQQDNLLLSSTARIKIIPSLDARPPICVADFPGEYALAKSTCDGIRFPAIPRTRELLIQASPPEQVVIAYPMDYISLRTCLYLTQMAPSTQECRLQQPKKMALCHCNGLLVASTFITSEPREKVPTLKDLASERTLSRNTHVCGKARASVVQFSKWREVTRMVRDGSNSTSKPITQWQTEAPLTLKVENIRPSYIVPSFESSLVSRRYKFDLRVRITEPRRCTFRLSLPVQILYRTDASTPAAVAETECPAYIP